MARSLQTVSQAMMAATGQLRQAGLADPARDARRLMAHAAGVDLSRLTLISQDRLETDVLNLFQALIDRRALSEPVSHLTGRRAFYGRDFDVTSDVLDPRPETETLIEAALAEPFSRVLDLGCGSGCILLTLLAERTGAVGQGVDLSMAACEVAHRNARGLGVSDRAIITQSDWFDRVSEKFDLIVSNPPYIAANEMDGLSDDVRLYEPHLALTDGDDGLSCYRAITKDVAPYLESNGRLIVEIGPTQGKSVTQMFFKAGLKHVQVIPDLDGRDRIVLGRKP